MQNYVILSDIHAVCVLMCVNVFSEPRSSHTHHTYGLAYPQFYRIPFTHFFQITFFIEMVQFLVFAIRVLLLLLSHHMDIVACISAMRMANDF
jgi:hypothetical protein